MSFNIMETLRKYKRVLIVARRPEMDELKETSKICGTGFFVIGIIGFVFYLISIVLGG